MNPTAVALEHSIVFDEWRYSSSSPGAGRPPESDWRPVGSASTAAAARRVVSPQGDCYPDDLDCVEHWFSAEVILPADFVSGHSVTLEFDGIASIAEIYWNGHFVGTSESMYAEHRIDVAERCRPGDNVLDVRCLSLTTGWRRARFHALAGKPAWSKSRNSGRCVQRCSVARRDGVPPRRSLGSGETPGSSSAPEPE